MSDLMQVESLTTLQVAQLHSLYQLEWWTKSRSLEDVRAAVENSSLIVGFVESESHRLVGFCRLLTDFVFRAMIYDVIVAEAWRGRGVGRRLMEAVANHPRLARVSAVSLFCVPEMVPFYEKWGFNLFSGEPRWMIKIQREG